MDHFGHLAGQAATVAPGGSVFFTAYSIWHRQSEKIDQSTRNLLKWEFWRTVPPKRDWIVDPNFDFAGADYSYTNPYFCWCDAEMAIGVAGSGDVLLALW